MLVSLRVRVCIHHERCIPDRVANVNLCIHICKHGLALPRSTTAPVFVSVETGICLLRLSRQQAACFHTCWSLNTTKVLIKLFLRLVSQQLTDVAAFYSFTYLLYCHACVSVCELNFEWCPLRFLRLFLLLTPLCDCASYRLDCVFNKCRNWVFCFVFW